MLTTNKKKTMNVYNELGTKIGSTVSLGEAERLHVQDFNKRSMTTLIESYAGVNTYDVREGLRPSFYHNND